MPDAPLNRFQLWVADAVKQAGAAVPETIDPLGLSYEAEGRVARIFPHADDGLAVVEVTAMSLDDLAEDDVAQLAVQLHRLNHEARFEHGWSIVIDDDDRLNVSTTVSTAETTGTRLTEILYDGIDRAKALSTVVAGLLSADASEPEPSAGAAGVIRG